MNNQSELVCNLWAFIDMDSQYIYALAGKVYSLQGTDEDKLNVLRLLSIDDHKTVQKIPVPDRFSIFDSSGSSKTSIAGISAFYDPNVALFEELFVHLQNQLPAIVDYSQLEPIANEQYLPNDPLCVSTLVCEDSCGNTRALVTDEDRAWFADKGLGNSEQLEEGAYNNVVGFSESATKSEVQRYFQAHMDMKRAVSEGNIFANPPIRCELCSIELIDNGFFVDGLVRGQATWACMCPECFSKYGQGLGWGVGQLYQNQGQLGWLQVAGFKS